MIKVNVVVPDPVTAAATYTGIQIGKASSQADAASQSGTFSNLGTVLSLDSHIGTYSYTDSASPYGYWYTWRFTGNSGSGSWSAPYQGIDTGYISVAELREYELGAFALPDGTDSSDNRLEKLVGVASRMVDGYCGFSFRYKTSVEQHKWNQNTRRVFPYSRPIVSVNSLEVYVSNQQRATFSNSDLYINSSQNYIEVTSLANVTYSLFPAIVALGLIDPVAVINYNHGYAVTPQEIKDATALIAIDLASRDALYQSGMGQLTRLTVGDTTMERLPQVAPGKQSALAIPPAAASILDQYIAVSIR